MSTGIEKTRAGVQAFEATGYPQYKDTFQQLAGGQEPHTLFITCSDSRILPALISTAGPGDLFMIRNVGNLVPEYKVGESSPEACAIEYALAVLKIQHVVVCGHSNCGAMNAVLGGKVPHDSPLYPWLTNANHDAADKLRSSDLEAGEKLRTLAEENVRLQTARLLTHPAAKDNADLKVSGWYYDIGEGKVWSVNADASAERTLVSA